jgi:putative intracellular protease/amidase
VRPPPPREMSLSAGWSPWRVQFRDDESLKQTIVAFYEAEKPTAVLCHGLSALIDVQLSDGSYLVEGKTARADATSDR